MKKLNYNAPICGTGYGLTSIHLLRELNKYYDITLFPISSRLDVEYQEDYDSFIELVDNNKSFDENAPCIKIWHQFDLASRIGKGPYYAFPIFELDTFTPKEKNHLNACDHIFVCSQWAKSIIESNNITKPTTVIPLGINNDIFSISDAQYDTNKYVFFSIGKWEYRKGHDVTIECFNKAFSENDNVELWLATHNPFLNKEELDYWHSLVFNSKLSKKIKIFNRLATQKDLSQFIQHGDCGLYLSRAEGWNLELLETICLNKPVITTNYSGHTEFCNDQNSFLVNITETEKAIDNKWFFGDGNWAKITDLQKDQIIHNMRHCYEKDIRSNAGYLSTKTKFTWENSAKKIVQCIN